MAEVAGCKKLLFPTSEMILIATSITSMLIDYKLMLEQVTEVALRMPILLVRLLAPRGHDPRLLFRGTLLLYAF